MQPAEGLPHRGPYDQAVAATRLRKAGPRNREQERERHTGPRATSHRVLHVE